MADILILYLQPVLGGNINNLACFYDSLNQELTKNGSSVLWFNTLQELSIKEKETKKLKKWLSEPLEKIKKFKPDIIFTFNNRIFEEVLEVTDCPVVLFEADLADFFVKTDLIKKYKERYYIASYNEEYAEKYKQLGFDENKIITIHRASAVQNIKKEKVNNISFIGSVFSQINTELKNKMMKNSSEVYKMYLEHWAGNYDYEGLFKKYLPDIELNVFDYYKIFDIRNYVLQSVLDIGLNLHGLYFDSVLPPALLPLSAAFDKTPKYSLKHNEDIYNSSYVNISISHPQCRGFDFPWRVYDIMASGGVLVSSYSRKLQLLTKDYIDIPMYKSPYEARDLCIKMLKEENLRNDIIEASNKFIEKFGRWQDNFEKLEQYTKVNLSGSPECCQNGENRQSAPSIIEYELEKPKVYTHAVSQAKSIFNGIKYTLSYLPILEGRINKVKIYKSMLKYDKELVNFINPPENF